MTKGRDYDGKQQIQCKHALETRHHYHRPARLLPPLTFLVLSRSKEWVKGLYSPPAEDKQRTGMPTEAGEAPERARALRAALEAATRSAEAISSLCLCCVGRGVGCVWLCVGRRLMRRTLVGLLALLLACWSLACVPRCSSESIRASPPSPP